MAVPPKKAATVILLRDERQGFEVFLLKRHEKSSFMGGNYVYPGGRVDRNDGSDETCALSRGLTPEEATRVLGGMFSPQECFAHWVAAIRELFEEAGVILAYHPKGNLLELTDKEEHQKLLHYREILQRGKLSIAEMARKENLLLAPDQLHYYAHWITPEARAERFDTRFFLARSPAGQEATHDREETTAGIWITPRKALEENLEGDVILSPPTLKTLEDLSKFKSIEEIFSSLKEKTIQPILPILTRMSDTVFIIFPWDPEYEVFKRGEVPSPLHHGRPSEQGDNTTRLLMKQDRWVPYCRNK